MEQTTEQTRGLIQYTCLRCNHKWIPRTLNPIACPDCNSPYWNDEYKNLKAKELRDKKLKK